MGVLMPQIATEFHANHGSRRAKASGADAPHDLRIVPRPLQRKPKLARSCRDIMRLARESGWRGKT